MKSERTTMLGFGDSILKNIVVNKTNDNYRYVVSEFDISEHLFRQMNIHVVNYGKMGCTISIGEQIVESHLNDIKPKSIALLEYGGNDSNYNWLDIAREPEVDHTPITPLKNFSETYKKIINEISNTGSIPIVLSLPPIDSERCYQYLTRKMNDNQKKNVKHWLNNNISTINYGHELYNLETLKIAQQMLVPWIDITSIFLSHRNYTDYICDDGLHPNAKGQELIANAIIKKLRVAV